MSKSKALNYIQHISTPTLDQLTKPKQRPPEYIPLYPYKRSYIAQYLGVGTIYVSNIFSGYKQPSQKLHNKIMELIELVKSEQALCSELRLIETVEGNIGGNN